MKTESTSDMSTSTPLFRQIQVSKSNYKPINQQFIAKHMLQKGTPKIYTFSAPDLVSEAFLQNNID